MFRAAVALVALTAFVPRIDVDATAFVLAFRAGRADEFRNKQISGVGTSFHGAVRERIADGSTRTSLVITLGAAGADGSITPLTSWDAFVAADRAHTTVVVALSGPDLPAPPTNGPAVYEFSGVYDGQVRSVPRAPDGRSVSPDTPCPGEKPRDQSGAESLYCAPLLTGATAALRR
jgi:hypothetical protein